MMQTDVDVEALSEKVIGCAIAVHRALGPGLLEIERRLALDYKGHRVADALKLDLLVEGCLVLELKAVDRLHPVHTAQTITYLKLTGCQAGLLLNFNAPTMKDGLRRLDHPDRYVRKRPGSEPL